MSHEWAPCTANCCGLSFTRCSKFPLGSIHPTATCVHPSLQGRKLRRWNSWSHFVIPIKTSRSGFYFCLKFNSCLGIQPGSLQFTRLPEVSHLFTQHLPCCNLFPVLLWKQQWLTSSHCHCFYCCKRTMGPVRPLRQAVPSPMPPTISAVHTPHCQWGMGTFKISSWDIFSQLHHVPISVSSFHTWVGAEADRGSVSCQRPRAGVYLHVPEPAQPQHGLREQHRVRGGHTHEASAEDKWG